MQTATAISIARAHTARRSRWQWVAVIGMAVALGGIMLGATGLTAELPIPEWGLAAVPLLGFGMVGIAGLRLMTMRAPARSNRPGSVPRRTTSKGTSPRTGWSSMAQAMETVRSGHIPLVSVPPSAGADERVAFEKANEAFQFLARRQKVIRAALDELRGELNNYHRYLTKSQVGLIGANSVAERLEQFDERLAKIRSAM